MTMDVSALDHFVIPSGFVIRHSSFHFSFVDSSANFRG
jgi:hypothetical protein